ncbi:ABC transporter substrate-binding protein [Frigoribacterium faeni]|uniref:Multiple sugar transport system substrate-binding protein n=1 Tax=Frigoribacterium faeni TaxID=145483 RepID=A0A7W3JK01_9MICO|nr:extracellular solute-binding protein [Frigoribacterium faeni]MBA8814296.1 multiple sugar transport system substrate-binding protein [Frigoribacterium faeni]BFF12724.1 extracellular solute-binding protein [Microbacterium flavescens]GEK83236.1 sugar ABC transporter substrate-binding protein [Frigoribacterium faeni]
MRHRTRTTRVAALATVMIAGVALTGCSADAGGPDVVQLDFWGWGTGQSEQVARFNAAHPGIQVRHTDAGGGDDSAPKLLTASRAGNAPDVALVEYTTLPSLIVAEVPREITEYVADVEDAFTEGTWAQTTFGGVVYGVPQDAAPMVYVYRSDVFAAAGQDAPTTWQDFAESARAVAEQQPGTVVASMPASELAFYAGVSAQAGADWWSVDDEGWTVGIADEASLEVADFFEGLADEGVIDTDPLLSPEYNKRVNDGTIAGWTAGIWAPSVLQGVAPDTAGQWEMAPLPQWTDGDPAIPFQGGSALIVTENSEHPAEAAEFASWMNASTEGNRSLLDDRDMYPASIVGQELAETNAPPSLMPQQTDFYSTAATISEDVIPVTWGPNVNLAKSVFTDQLNKAIRNGTPWRDAFIATQNAVVADMEKVGYDVKTDG